MKDASRFAVVDVGSNTVHLLVADSDGRRVAAVDDQSTRLGLGADVAQWGAVQPDKIRLVTEVVQAYVDRANQAGAKMALLLGTQAVRAAGNGPQLAEDVKEATGLPLHVIDPGAEARLGYLGTTLDIRDKNPHLVVDIGGGSTQMLLAERRSTTFLGSLPLGSVSLPARYLAHDPPTASEQQDIDRAVQQTLAEVSFGGGYAPRFGVLVGGVGRRLKRAGRIDARAPLARLWIKRLVDATMTASAGMMEIFGAVLMEDADMVRAGALVLCQIMEAFDLDHCFVSDKGIREGAVLALARGEELHVGA